MTSGQQEHARVNSWINLTRRARLGKNTKAVVNALATYASADGGDIYPGLARLSLESEIPYSTLKKEMARLRAIGLIRKVGKRGDADVYQLIVGEQLMEHIEVPSPTAFEALVEALRIRIKGTYTPRHSAARRAVEPVSPPSLRLIRGAADATPPDTLRLASGAADTTDDDPLRLTQESRRNPPRSESAAQIESRRPESAAQNDPICGSPRRAATQDPPVSTTLHSDEDLRTAVTLSRARDRDAQDQNSRGLPAPTSAPPSPSKCLHGLEAGDRPDGQPRCPICRRLPKERTA